MTEKHLRNVIYSTDEVGNIIRGLDPNKAHGKDKISIRMRKICGNSICKPLEIIYKEYLNLGLFPLEWKKGNVFPIHKMDQRQCLKNYRPVSLPLICGKILEKIIFNKTFQFFIKNKLIPTKQSGFKPEDSCIHQLLCITHDIYKSFDEGCEVRGVFLHILKAFDKVWHEDIIFKLKQNSIGRNLLKFLADFLKDRKQRVALNEQVSNWADVIAGVPKGSILGPFFFLVYINDLATGLSSNAKLFADDT